MFDILFGLIKQTMPAQALSLMIFVGWHMLSLFSRTLRQVQLAWNIIRISLESSLYDTQFLFIELVLRGNHSRLEDSSKFAQFAQ